MKLSEFKNLLETHSNRELCFVLPDGGRIPVHAHITEVGRVDKTFIDCGGTVRKSATCSLQAWVAEDLEHRLLPGKLAGIIDIAKPLFFGEDLEVEIEYEDGFISQFPVAAAESSDDRIYFHLGSKHTDCLAKDVCLPESGCCSGSGCC